ncbi:hypothetical protein B9Z55_002231 [Caenorhabditis nigoni]|uniref:Uncharacterized protein n=1 Tax=Caenorhabditis nigoni TaxID=1611254 RepID=A0A2G5VJS0_9PELO|nr:hypothetical protein B9Z55_002231 [Caenorhabditis nigoni]
MASTRFSGIKNKLQKFGFSPSKDKPPKTPSEQEKKQEKPKKLNYKKKMKQRYNLTDEQFEEEKKIAQKQLKNWEEHRKERVLQIFQSNSEYVSKSSKSDVRHPKMARANTVFNSRGEKVDVEFGRLREFYLYTLAPSKEFVSIRDHTAHDKELTGLRAKQQIILENRKDKQATKNKLTEYERSKSVYEDPIAPRHVKAAKPDQKEAIEDTAPIDKFS